MKDPVKYVSLYPLFGSPGPYLFRNYFTFLLCFAVYVSDLAVVYCSLDILSWLAGPGLGGGGGGSAQGLGRETQFGGSQRRGRVERAGASRGGGAGPEVRLEGARDQVSQ